MYFILLEEFCAPAPFVNNTVVQYFIIPLVSGNLDEHFLLDDTPHDTHYLDEHAVLFANDTYVWYECASNYYRYDGKFTSLCEADLTWSNQDNPPICKGKISINQI